MASTRILMVDDEPDRLASAAAYFTGQGCAVAVATSGRQAIRALETEWFDLLVLDTLLPDSDAYLILAAARERYPERPFKTLVLTTIAADGEPGRDWSMPVDHYLLKPFTHWQLVLAMEQCLYRP